MTQLQLLLIDDDEPQQLSPQLSPRERLHRKCTLDTFITGLETPFVPQATEIVPNLFLADLFTATDPMTLASLGITHRLSVVVDPVPMPQGLPLKTKIVALQDTIDSRLWMYLEDCIQWLEAALGPNPQASSNRVLVHCRWGRSRSVAMVLGYLMKVTGHGLDQCLAHVQSRRPIAKPNEGFMRQLRSYERGLTTIAQKRASIQA